MFREMLYTKPESHSHYFTTHVKIFLKRKENSGKVKEFRDSETEARVLEIESEKKSVKERAAFSDLVDAKLTLTLTQSRWFTHLYFKTSSL
jgi:hypothetical protein